MEAGPSAVLLRIMGLPQSLEDHWHPAVYVFFSRFTYSHLWCLLLCGSQFRSDYLFLSPEEPIVAVERIQRGVEMRKA